MRPKSLKKVNVVDSLGLLRSYLYYCVPSGPVLSNKFNKAPTKAPTSKEPLSKPIYDY